MNWKLVLIPEVLYYQEGPGVRNTQFTEKGVKLLNVGNINGGKLSLDATKIYISDQEAYGKYSHFLVEEGDLLIASSGIVVDNFHNKITFAKAEHLPLCMNTSTIRFRPLNNEILNIQFFSQFLKTVFFTKQLSRLITGSAQLNFGPSHLKQIQMPLPPINIQKQIANILDKADTLRKKDKQLLQYYDDLAQSLFIDMFGDPVKNEKNWKRFKVGDVSKSKLGKMLDEKKYTGTSLYKYLGNSNVLWHDFNLTNLKEIDFTNEERVKYSLENGDVLMCEGGDAGRCAIWKSDIANTFFQKAIHRIRLDLSIIDPNYFVWMMYFFSKKGGLKNYITSATIAHLTGEKLKSLPIPIPPIALQNQFAERIQNIEQQKGKLKLLMQESENLFQALLQKAFNGDLN